MRAGVGLGVPGGGRRRWTPLALGAKLRCWLRGGVGITQVAGPKVSAWADQSGNANDFSQATDANRPLVTTVNGITVPDCTGSATRLLGPAQSALLTATAYEWWVVVRKDTEPGTARLVGEDGQSKGAYTRWVTNNVQAVQFGGAGTVTTSIALSLSVVYLVGQRYDGASLYTEANGTTQSAAGTLVDDLTGIHSFGGFDGPICELVVTNAVLSAAERTSLKSYLVAKFGATP